jgi:signal transduction histidine kinase/ActR/RegA family two-component response regulator/HAMP domain-containing protein
MIALFRNLSIQRKLTLMIMAASTVALLLVSAGFVTYEVVTFRRSMIRDLSSLAELLGNQSTAALTYDDKPAAEEILSGASARRHIVAARLYKGDKPFAQYPLSFRAGEPLPAHPEPQGFRFESDRLVLFYEIKLAGEQIGTLCLASTLDEVHERLTRYAGIIAIFILTSSLVTYLLSLVLQRIISRPISHLADTAKAVSMNKNYTVRASKGAEDELGQLIDGFNEMLSQIQQRDAALQQVNDKLEKRVFERTQDLQQEIVERKRVEEALQEQLTRIRLLNQIIQIISDRQDLNSLLRVVLRQLGDRLGINWGVVCLYDATAETFKVTASHAVGLDSGPALPFGQGAVLLLGDTGLQPCLRGELVRLEAASPPSKLAEQLGQAGLKTALAVPLIVQDKLFGILLVTRSTAEAFTSGECDFLRTLSEHVGLAAHQARLYTELELAYNELRQTQQNVMQQDRLRALGQMASGIAHDINNALSPVVGFADLLTRSESLSENGKKYLRYIKTAGEDIAKIVARLREFYRRRGQKEPLAAFNLNQTAQQVIDMTRPRWRDIPQSRGVVVEVEADMEETLPQLVGNQSEVREALTNLILNAVDALPKGGNITVRTRSIRAMAGAGPGGASPHVMLEVRDNGVGMDEITRKHCLEPFFSTKGKRGTGLGLAMVYGVLERHEGKIEIQSELGKGTSIILIFPVKQGEAAQPAQAPEPVPVDPLQILCIDDEPLLRELLKNLLESDGHQVEVTDGGQAGLEAFRAAHQRGRPFDVVITDLGMPYLDGRQVARTLKKESPRTPIILLTGWGAFMKEDGEFPAQVDSVLSKPPRSRELREALQKLTANSRTPTPAT